MSTAKIIAKGSAWMLVATFIVKFLGFIYLIILARTVPEKEIGMFFLVLSVISIVGLFSDFGLGIGAVARYVPFYAGKEKFNHVRKVLKISLSAGTIFSIICTAFVILFANDLASFFGNPNLVPIFYIMAFHFLISNVYSTAYGFLQGRKLPNFVSYLVSVRDVSKVTLTLIFLFLIGFNAEGITVGYILAYLFTAVIGGYWLLKEYNLLPRSHEEANYFSLLKDMVPFGLTLVFISSMGMINTYTDRIMLGYFFPGEVGEAMVGIYTMVIGFAMLINIFGGAIGTIFSPLITEFWSKKDVSRINKTTITVIRWLSLTTLPLLLAMLIFPKQILTIIYGQDYAIGHIVLMIYSIGLFIYLFSQPSQWILAAMKRLDVTRKIIAVGATINVILNFIFIPKYGINGAALTSAISLTIMTILFLKQSKITNVQIPKDIYKPIIAGLITIILLFFLKPYMGEILRTIIPSLIQPTDIISEIIEKLLKIIVLGILVSTAFLIYLIFLIQLKAFHKEDVEILSGAMRRLKIPKRWISITERVLLR